MGGSFAPVWVAAFTWNGWQTSLEYAIRYVTPNQRHHGEEHRLLKRRDAVYNAAKQRNPQRWSGNTRNWTPVTEVWLNPPKEHQAEKKRDLKGASSMDTTTSLTNTDTPRTMVRRNPKLVTDRRGHAEPGATGNGMPKGGMMKTVDATTTLKNADSITVKYMA